jgi:DNA-binding XRE family transcriptional regulator
MRCNFLATRDGGGLHTIVDKLKVCKPRSSAYGYAQTGRPELRRLRREKGLTQEEVEARSGFSQQYLSSLERGRRNPTVITLYELSQALGVSHVELVQPDHQA